MDILNWLFLRTSKLIKTKPNNAKTDLIALGADVTFQKRDDRYQTYAMTLEDAVNSVACAKDTYETGVYSEYPYVVFPTLADSCTFIENVGGLYPSNLKGHKVVGSVQFDGFPSYSYPIGTVIYPNTPANIFLPWKIVGTVSYTDNTGNIINNALGLYNTAFDTGASFTNCQVYFETTPNTVGSNVEVDIVIYVDATSIIPLVGDLECVVTFEYEFLIEEGVTPTFVV